MYQTHLQEIVYAQPASTETVSSLVKTQRFKLGSGEWQLPRNKKACSYYPFQSSLQWNLSKTISLWPRMGLLRCGKEIIICNYQKGSTTVVMNKCESISLIKLFIACNHYSNISLENLCFPKCCASVREFTA